MVMLCGVTTNLAQAEVGGTITRNQGTHIDTIVNIFLGLFTWKSDQGTLTFSDGRYSATAGCNTLSGAYTLRGTTLTTEGPIATKMYCEGKMENEQKLSDILSEVTTLTVTKNGLHLSHGTSSLTFTPTFTSTEPSK